MAGASRARLPRRSLVALAVIGVLAVGYLAVSARTILAGSVRPWPAPKAVGTTYLQVAKSRKGLAMLGVYVALATREAAGGAPGRLIMPTDLLAVENHRRMTWDGHTPRPLITVRYLEPLLGGNLTQVAYDPRLDPWTTERILADPKLIRYPMDVFAIPSPNPHGDFAVFADPKQSKVIVIPVSMAPAGVLK